MPAEFLIPLAALLASLLTFYSGFGLGTLLMPVFAVFFPVEAAIGMTAVVHLLNNLFKIVLLWSKVSKRVVLFFGVASMIGAWFGAEQLMQWMELPPLYAGVRFPVSVTDVAIGSLMIVFALLELVPATKSWSVPPRFMF
ncbi:MAG TPA: TSUP family transporter, partial [Flavobacteriales bacterium]|nr:TSUP family transporter [Flavobacteriales bacterium]